MQETSNDLARLLYMVMDCVSSKQTDELRVFY